MGIKPAGIFAKATGIAMIIVTIAALYLGMRSNFDPSIGPARLIYAFEAVIIGGLGSLWGTLAGGMIIGVAQTVGAAINPEWQILAGHGLPDRAACASPRPVPESGGLIMTEAHDHDYPFRPDPGVIHFGRSWRSS
jgi:ABC-type branched-subunit amino acid transport system permease subunit